MSRYELPSPKCNHAYSKRVIRVASHDHYVDDEPFVSAWICERETCLADADAWVRASTHLEPIHIVSPRRAA